MAPNERIALVGSACRFPGGAGTPSKLWDLLLNPIDVQSEVPKDRFNINSFYHPDGSHQGRTNARHGYFLGDDVRAFDAPFFNIQAAEAESMDPQQRLLLETTYDAISSAGLQLHEIRGSDTALYVGIMTHDFEITRVQDLEHSPPYLVTGSAMSIASNRVSYCLDWHGPSMTIDTACSSSLVAVHHAVQQLRSGQSRMAVAAGSNLILSPLGYIMESKLNMLSPTGRSRMWDTAADGYARGEGICAVVLKTLSQALLDGDSIQCVIRETGVNQDGRTTGITMPSHRAQEELIRTTYARAGLDLNKTQDRCQYFEAHGTGTPAGDPQEAEAISKAFFGHGHHNTAASDDQDKLFVGSIKSVLGHSEGTAGLAGLMKASLAIQHGVVPPNMLLENLSPRVAPFASRLRVARQPQPWPAVGPGQPRRASVNSFGFGGTNAHAIIEEYVPEFRGSDDVPDIQRCSAQAATKCSLPLVFSARSERSLRGNMEKMRDFIKAEPHISMIDLAWTLLQKQSVLPIRLALVGQTRETACVALEQAIKGMKPSNFTSTEAKETPRVIGIFTGQGAQWPGMMKSLLLGIPYAKNIVDELDASLQTLPAHYRPSWRLQDQFMLEDEASMMGSAAISQPLCCAVQVVLVQLLRAAGVTFTTVVGHSSGETACAFAAGFISASMAIRIAYIRGLISQAASSPNGEKGSMLATDLTHDDAKDLCDLEEFKGRVCVGAYNSPNSVTISGDESAIHQIQAILEDENRFSRLIKVDKAYHSHHMHSSSLRLMEALADCQCVVADCDDNLSVAWYSSVYEHRRMRPDDLTKEYWKDHLTSPVLFSQALEEALTEHHSLDVAVEVGCHPALKSPSLATMKVAIQHELPYIGCMDRKGTDMDVFTRALGQLWERFDVRGVDADAFISTTSPQHSIKNLANGLPPYCWDHSRLHWTESRAIHAHLCGDTPHLLLGTLSADSTASTLRWHNTFKPEHHEWLQGHILQGQIVFPAAGYVVMAMEAAIYIAGERPIELIELLHMSLDKAVTFNDKNSLAELNLTATVSRGSIEANLVTLAFSIDSCLSKESKLSTSARGQITLTFGSNQDHVLPPPRKNLSHLAEIDLKVFYRELDTLGYNYEGYYRDIYSMGHADGQAKGAMAYPPLSDGKRRIILHPASLDLAFQSVNGAYSYPGDKRLRSLYVPVHIGRLALVPSVCWSHLESSTQVEYNTINTYDKGDTLWSNVEVFNSGKGVVLYQVEDLIFSPLVPPSAAEDHCPFTKCCWGPMIPAKTLDNPQYWATDEERLAIPVIERLVYFYVKEFLGQLTEEDRLNATVAHRQYISWCEHVQSDATQGRHKYYSKSWERDTCAQIENLCEQYCSHPHVRMVQRVSENMLTTIRENGNPFHFMDRDGLLSEFYTHPWTVGPSLFYAVELIEEISHRFQCMDVLEIGAGTGGATSGILGSPRFKFNTYTYTDISTSFFDKAREKFIEYEDLMEFRRLDIRQSPKEQGFQPHSYDLIIAYSCLHATPKLDETMINVRSLLKPGGHVVIVEATHHEHTRSSFLFGLFPDWWAGVEEGRVTDPFATVEEWDIILRNSGFSGIDSRTLDRDKDVYANLVFSSHAVDAQVLRLDAPLMAPLKESYPDLVIIGGDSSSTSPILDRIRQILPNRRPKCIKRLEDVCNGGPELTSKSTFLVLSELDNELFSDLNERKFRAVKRILSYAKSILWLTENAWIDHPYQSMTIGLLRSARTEYTETRVQLLDIDDISVLETNFLVEQVLRLEESSSMICENMAWTDEPEIYVSNGLVLLPRVKQDTIRNNRMNSARREIFADADLEETPVTLRTKSVGTRYLESTETFNPTGAVCNTASHTIIVHYASAKALRAGDAGYLHVVQGTVKGTDKIVLALSCTNASIVEVPAHRSIVLPDDDGPEMCYVLTVVASLLARAILAATSLGTSILIFEPPGFCVEAIIKTAKERSVRVHFATAQQASVAAETEGASWLRLHPQETNHQLRKILPSDISAMYDFSSDAGVGSLSHRTAANLPPGCSVVHKAEHYIRDVAFEICSPGGEHLFRDVSLDDSFILQSANDLAGTATANAAIVTASEVTDSKFPFDLLTVIDWQMKRPIPVRIRPIDAGNLFVQDRTYLLIGLAGSLGRSLARWMIMHGARHVVLSSRNPETPDPDWIADIEKLNGEITVVPMDASLEQSLDAGLSEIHQKLPPIGGIAYGPLVLRDALLRNMQFSEMEDTLKSKATGARLLNERFSTPESPLDFFVMFSSMVTVVGNPGQSNYSAANAYIQALAQQRQAKGLAGSVIHIGAVIGVGYLNQYGRTDEVYGKADTLNEHELHTLFAEAIVSGRNEAAGRGNPKTLTDMAEIDLISGIPQLDYKYIKSVKFAEDPRVSSLKIPEPRNKTGDLLATCGTVRERLLEATTMDEVHQVLIDGLSDKLRASLQVATEDNVNADMPLVDQGFDSLGAITISSWFSKQLLVDIPLLSVLSGASIADLCKEAAGRLPSSLIPLVHSEGHDLTDRLTHDGLSEESLTSQSPNLSTAASLGNGCVPAPSSMPFDTPDKLRWTRLSLGQEYSWKLQRQKAESPTIFNNTVGIVIEGYLDPEKLNRAFESMIYRHEIFRTAFTEPVQHAHEPKQAVMKTPASRFHAVQVTSREAAELEYQQIESARYDIARGETLKVVDYYWSEDRHFLVIGYHRLIGDGTTTQNIFAELGQLYNGVALPPPVQFIELAAQQRLDFEEGRINRDIAYWISSYQATPPSVMPIMSLPGARRQRSPDISWQQHTTTLRLDAPLASRIRQQSRQHGATPLQFYLTTYHIILARLSGSGDIGVGIADTGRSSLAELSCMGFFANLLPVRMPIYSASTEFSDDLMAVKKLLIEAMQHSRVPYGVTLERLGLSVAMSSDTNGSRSSHAPLFQAVFDYKQGQTDSGEIGDAHIVETMASRERTPYDVVLEVSDDPARAPLITVKLQSSIYSQLDVLKFIEEYSSALDVFSKVST